MYKVYDILFNLFVWQMIIINSFLSFKDFHFFALVQLLFYSFHNPITIFNFSLANFMEIMLIVFLIIIIL